MSSGNVDELVKIIEEKYGIEREFVEALRPAIEKIFLPETPVMARGELMQMIHAVCSNHVMVRAASQKAMQSCQAMTVQLQNLKSELVESLKEFSNIKEESLINGLLFTRGKRAMLN